MELAPSFAPAQSALAEVYFRQARFAEAEETLQKLAKAKTTDARTFLTFARIYWATANNKMAKSCIDFAHQLDPKDPDIDEDWVATLPRSQRLAEWRKRLAKGAKDEQERESLTAAVSVLEDLEKQPSHSCKLTAKSLPAETNLESLLVDARRRRGVGLLVKVNDTPSKLLVDTGASGITVNSKIAERRESPGSPTGILVGLETRALPPATWDSQRSCKSATWSLRIA